MLHPNHKLFSKNLFPQRLLHGHFIPSLALTRKRLAISRKPFVLTFNILTISLFPRFALTVRSTSGRFASRRTLFHPLQRIIAASSLTSAMLNQFLLSQNHKMSSDSRITFARNSYNILPLDTRICLDNIQCRQYRWTQSLV